MTLIDFVNFLANKRVDHTVQKGLVTAYHCLREDLLFERSDIKGRSVCSLYDGFCMYQDKEKRPKGDFKKLHYCRFGTRHTDLDDWITQKPITKQFGEPPTE